MKTAILLLVLMFVASCSVGCSKAHTHVVAFGDSITVGRPFDGEHAYSYAYGFASDLGLALDNQAVSGSRLDEDTQAGRIERYDFSKVSVVLILTGTNSAMQFGTDPAQVDQFKIVLRDAIELIAKNNLKLIIGTTPNTGETYEAAVLLYAQAIRDVVSDLHLSNVYLADVQAQMAFSPDRYVADLTHPNLDGQQMILDIFEGAK